MTQDDIVENPKNLKFVEMKSLTIPAAIQDFDYVIITGSIVYNAGIDPLLHWQPRTFLITLSYRLLSRKETKC